MFVSRVIVNRGMKNFTKLRVVRSAWIEDLAEKLYEELMAD